MMTSHVVQCGIMSGMTDAIRFVTILDLAVLFCILQTNACLARPFNTLMITCIFDYRCILFVCNGNKIMMSIKNLRHVTCCGHSTYHKSQATCTQ